VDYLRTRSAICITEIITQETIIDIIVTIVIVGIIMVVMIIHATIIIGDGEQSNLNSKQRGLSPSLTIFNYKV
jgi:hypothetical protein